MNLISNRAEVAKIMENGGGRGAEEVERKLLLLSPPLLSTLFVPILVREPSRLMKLSIVNDCR